VRVILGSCFTVLLATIGVAVDCDDLPDSATGFLNHEHVPWTRWRVAGVRTNQSSVPGADRSGGQGHVRRREHVQTTGCHHHKTPSRFVRDPRNLCCSESVNQRRVALVVIMVFILQWPASKAATRVCEVGVKVKESRHWVGFPSTVSS